MSTPDKAMAQMAKWLKHARADDFKPVAEGPEEEAWKHIFAGVQIMFREGYTAAGINMLLGEVLETFEIEDDDQWELHED